MRRPDLGVCGAERNWVFGVVRSPERHTARHRSRIVRECSMELIWERVDGSKGRCASNSL